MKQEPVPVVPGGSLDENNLKGIQPQIDVVARMLNGLRATLKKKA